MFAFCDVEQSRDAVDKGLHSGGAFSAVVPLTTLFYGGFINVDVADPTRRGQDMFTLSKGHAVATLASIYADLGYFDKEVLKNSRSFSSILNGHPGPVLPGVQIATGPMGQGFSVAQGFAIAGRTSPQFDSYAMVGDGELQEGNIWEGVMYAGTKHLDNLCVLVDQNNGQLDIATKTIFPMPHLETVFESFGWQTFSVDSTHYEGVYAALEKFRYSPRNGKPTAIVCHSTKGYGGFSDFLNKHKVSVADGLIKQELDLHRELRRARVEEVNQFFQSLDHHPKGKAIQSAILESSAKDAPEPGTQHAGRPGAFNGPGTDHACSAAQQEDSIRRLSTPEDRQQEGVCGERYRYRRHEGVRKGFADRVDRCGSWQHQWPRSRHRVCRSEARSECWRRGSQHDVHRRSVCRPGF